ncbi:MAG: emp24/gp25L/p24 family protein [Candidatus Acidiferrales bacterium]
MRRLLFLFIFCAVSTFAQGPAVQPGARIYIVPSGGFEARLSAALSKRHVPVVVVTQQSQADFTVTPNVNALGKETFIEAKISDTKTDEVVWNYTEKEKKYIPDKAADAIAKRLKSAMQPPPSYVSATNAAPQMTDTPASQTLCFSLNPIVIAPGHYWFVRFQVDTSTMQDVRVEGSFEARGGSGNDVQVAIGKEDDFLNWINGHEGSVLYASDKVTAGKIDVPINESGNYVLAFSNTFSLVSRKIVQADVSLMWQK